ncbi:hypothetical protein [Streptomyces sp. NPDC001601]|uniref:hypothetical protein n=1 Tax=Streptomyces sp. NPDC001601 TaxID=3364592 RepID=UPI0036754872
MIVQPPLEVPAKIAAGIASGKYIRIGGVVRNALSGRIVTFLKEAPGAENNQEAIGRAAAVLRSRNVIVFAALGTLAAGATAFVVVNKLKQAGEREVPECVANLNVSLSTYLNAARKGSLDARIISGLISDLDAVEAYSDNASVAVDFSTGLWQALVNLVVDHTRKLAEAYAVDLEEFQGKTSGNSSVIDLRRHLEFQRQIIAGAA